MSAWPGKYVIGLTGNIATGKSVVRRMLEHLGAYGIDADALAHRAIAQGAPGYKPVLEIFGHWILAADGQIDRSRLARVVFSDPEALARLESILHPLVLQAVDVLVRRASQRVVVIEAIKLIESGLRGRCDSLWVTYAPQEIQLVRLLQKRKMGEAAARQRVAVQPPQEAKVGAADVVIRNQGSFEDTWQQVLTAWQRTFSTAELPQPVSQVQGAYAVQRAGPGQAQEIAAFITRISQGQRRLSRSDVMAAFGEKAFLLLKLGSHLIGLVGWQVENLVARVDDIYLEAGQPLPPAIRALMDEVERASRELQSEVALVFLHPGHAGQVGDWSALGYQPSTVAALGVRAWQEAAIESMPVGSQLLVKLLRKDRVLRPV